MRIPGFSRHPATDTADDRSATAFGSTVAKPDDATTTQFPSTDQYPPASQFPAAGSTTDRSTAHDTGRSHEPVLRDKKPRASLMATLGLILGVAAALLVLSGPLLGYGIGVAVLGLVVSLAGMFATRRRHVAGKTDALIGIALSLAAIVVGLLALTGSLSWLGTDMQPVNSLREWLDARFADRL